MEYARQREMLTELVAALVKAGGGELEPWIAPECDAAADEGGRLRVVIDQVSSLTDASAVAWHARLCHSRNAGLGTARTEWPTAT